MVYDSKHYMQNYVSLSVDYVNFNNASTDGGGGGLGGRASEGLGGREKGEKGEKNEKSGIINTNSNNGELVYKTIVMPFYLPLIDYVISNDFFIEIVDTLNKNHVVIGGGKIRKYRLNGSPSNYDMFIETEIENVFHINKRGVMMRLKVNDQQYKTIIKILTNLNNVPGAGAGAGAEAGNSLGNVVTSSPSNSPGNPNAVILGRGVRGSAKKTGLFKWFKCFSAN
jgi:hypothetical protein